MAVVRQLQSVSPSHQPARNLELLKTFQFTYHPVTLFVFQLVSPLSPNYYPRLPFHIHVKENDTKVTKNNTSGMVLPANKMVGN